MTDVSRTDFTRRNDSFDQRKSGEEQKRKRSFPIHLVANILLYYSDLCWVILNSNVCSLNWYFLPESRPFMDDKREFPLVGSAALVSAACSRQLLCRINLIIATILFSFLFFKHCIPKDYQARAGSYYASRQNHSINNNVRENDLTGSESLTLIKVSPIICWWSRWTFMFRIGRLCRNIKTKGGKKLQRNSHLQAFDLDSV